MNSVERVKSICKERKIPLSRLEKDLGFANGYIGQLKKGTFPDDRIYKIAEYLHLSVDYIRNEQTDSNTLSNADKKDITRDLDLIMQKLERGEDGPVRYNGQDIDDNSRMLLRSAIEFGLTQLKIENKELYNPNKNKK
jgi:transcriptional regulator with XRE-family HTH domain